ncbi:c-type cytochrome [Blattabacterium cuenoti]|uniref:c-type cytochrome n=1 Tax=Blattabacterium cuenoti TaxID=1653831 RepID=UPI00163C025E|nr:c-type cytochrome [Blattabacterium cuenoti]
MIKKIILIFLIFFRFYYVLKAEENNIKISGNAENGYTLFNKNCASCHALDKNIIGPALSGITKKRNAQWLHKWISDNKSFRKSGNKEAIAIYKKYGNIEMNSFPNLSEKQIDDILFFIEHPINNKKKKITKLAQNTNSIQLEQTNYLFKKIIIFGLSIFSIIIIIILYRIKILFDLLQDDNDIMFLENKNSLSYINRYLIIFLGKSIKNWYFISSTLILLFLSNIYGIWYFLMHIDINKGYKPIQPIYFSHKIHSGINKIDCQYCHSSAKYGKVAGIPSTNICMNCHNIIQKYEGNYIEKGKSQQEYNNEIQKIYSSIGWNPNIRKFYKKSQPIKWIRIHNMPDFVNFDHSQHIISGEKMIKKFKKVNITCTACHGEVKNMDQIEMANDFSMEWCISCHRKIEINKKNQYYDQYFTNFIQQNKNITVDMTGGIECAKCHY